MFSSSGANGWQFYTHTHTYSVMHTHTHTHTHTPIISLLVELTNIWNNRYFFSHGSYVKIPGKLIALLFDCWTLNIWSPIISTLKAFLICCVYITKVKYLWLTKDMFSSFKIPIINNSKIKHKLTLILSIHKTGKTILWRNVTESRGFSEGKEWNMYLIIME